MHRAGFVNIIGNPNVGKSTLMNALVGERLSIITSKAQTTRHRIMGIVNGEDFQIVYSDTPGILKPSYKLQESMMNFVRGAVDDADVILYVTDTVERSDRSDELIERINRSGIPVITVINKIDLADPQKLDELVDAWHAKMPDAMIVPVSAREQFNMKGVLDAILERLPEGEAFYPKDTLTDKTLRFFASEIIREKILLNYEKEIPYCCEIEIDHRPHLGHDIRRAQLAERHRHRSQGREAEACRTCRARGYGAFPRQEGVPATLRQGAGRLARQRAAAAPFRLRSAVTAVEIKNASPTFVKAGGSPAKY